MKSSMLIAAALLLGGCSTVQTVVQADPVIAGKTYANNRPVPLGRVKMSIALHPQVVGDDAAVAEQVEITLGFAATGEPASVVARSGALKSKKDGAEAELVGRFNSSGTSIGCVAEAGGELGLEYWFNGMVKSEPWRCVTLRFRLPGHQPQDPIELTFEPINVGGELVRTLPVTFAFRTEQIEAD
jgi:hypothetical protein